jgi:Rieske Fe-S protein
MGPQCNTCSRRAFCIKLSQMAITTAAVVYGLSSCTNKLSENGAGVLAAGQTLTIDLTLPQNAVLLNAGGAAYAANGLMIVYRASATQVNAFSSTCTHQGCALPLPVNGVITCGCHFSTFDTQGNVTGGPATSNLQTFPAVLNGATIMISSSQKTTAQQSSQTVTADISQAAFTALQTVGGAAYADSNRLVLIRSSANQVTALSAICTHAGCTVSLPNSGSIQCSCHGSAFNLQGAVTNGPAQTNLPSYPATLSGNIITVAVNSSLPTGGGGEGGDG